ncbi:uncharacterized protein [Parasteatoda tepidariorum]|uniref:uncharacterized protein n=1 Tax=Parasteatoda tepidariorum TaxID=114398 RepID=UPI0039BC89ED
MWRGLCRSIFTKSLERKRQIHLQGVHRTLRVLCNKSYSSGASASKILKEDRNWRSITHTDKVSHHPADNDISWHFNTPSAPHMGGIWEAGVKSVKYHLRRILGHTILSYEEFYTLLVQIEACLNSRPITPISSDPNDLAPLTPGHFLTGQSLTSVPERDYSSLPDNRLSRWNLLQKLIQTFWYRWKSEYLSRLQNRPKWYASRQNIKVGDLVIIKNDNLPPLKWNLGKVIETFPGSDDKIRVASLKTVNGIIKIPIVKLCLLPLDSTI